MEKEISRVLTITRTLKKWMTVFVLFLTSIIVFASVIELAIVLFEEITDSTDSVLFLEINELFRIFGFVFIILIGFELHESIEMYFKKNVIHAEVVLLIAVIAVARKVILLDLEKYDPMAIVGLGFIIVALGACYFLIKRASAIVRTSQNDQ
ncbi:phosphate-starvation-inducible PsiE family protein [Endozoicomonas sp. G2_1]|uniref:phosphate-starvation-inducible PsiE family protein n=1 Tax=Endozoicomonas sp. G2_1 TaxID=2821091 RepID=UPI001ADCFAF8|nr:phosphate-starvation-inducible PsiE family protein [Endozoicomonas sp. G2_1]MBO9489549.1 phosphate-starvation-inducible PsiE family protein [Endozoicomonas sp. G2_1]